VANKTPVGPYENYRPYTILELDLLGTSTTIVVEEGKSIYNRRTYFLEPTLLVLDATAGLHEALSPLFVPTVC